MPRALRENHEVIYASMIKDTMKRKKPSFDEETTTAVTDFTHLLEDADNLALVDIERNPKSSTYMVTGFNGEQDRKNNRAVRLTLPCRPRSRRPNSRRDRGARQAPAFQEL